MGTSDITVLNISDGVFHVKSTAGDTHLGGQDFDNVLCEYFCTQFKRKYKIDLKNRPKSLKRLLLECDKVKRVLSTSTQANVSLDALCEGIDFDSSITRARFEELCSTYFRKCVSLIESTLNDSGLSKDKIDQVVLVGGSTRIPKIQQLISHFFDGKQLNKSINPDEAIAYGATVQAALLSGIEDEKIDDILLLDVAPLSIGLDVHGGLMSVIIPRNTTIPVKRMEEYTTFSDDQEMVSLRVFEGERQMTAHNRLLGEFHLTGIPKLPRGAPRIQVVFEIDADGILNITAWNKDSDNKEQYKIEETRSRLSKDDIESFLEDAKAHEEEDAKERDRIEARNDLEDYLYRISMTRPDNNAWQTYLDTVYDWFEASGDTGTREQFEEKIEEVEEMLTAIPDDDEGALAVKMEGGTSLDDIEDLGFDEIDFDVEQESNVI